jgi:uncharacterized membrane protein
MAETGQQPDEQKNQKAKTAAAYAGNIVMGAVAGAGLGASTAWFDLGTGMVIGAIVGAVQAYGSTE